MVAEPYEEPGFQNAVTYTVAVTVTVRGGMRSGTAQRRARKIAERLANTAAGAKDVVEATAVAGPSRRGETLWSEPVCFTAANTGRPDWGEPAKLSRYLDPEHERALRLLAEHNRRCRVRREADRGRRLAVGCRNAAQVPGFGDVCACVYCQPDDHYVSRQLYSNSDRSACGPPPCVCGQPTPAGGRCQRHGDVAVVAFDSDPDALQALADHHQPDPR